MRSVPLGFLMEPRWCGLCADRQLGGGGLRHNSPKVPSCSPASLELACRVGFLAFKNHSPALQLLLTTSQGCRHLG